MPFVTMDIQCAFVYYLTNFSFLEARHFNMSDPNVIQNKSTAKILTSSGNCADSRGIHPMDQSKQSHSGHSNNQALIA